MDRFKNKRCISLFSNNKTALVSFFNALFLFLVIQCVHDDLLELML